MLTALILSLSLSAAPKVDARLVGTWMGGDEIFIVLAADGTATMDTDALKWTADGATLHLTDADGDTDKGTYRVKGDVLLLTLEGLPLELRRAPARKAPLPKKQGARP